MAGIRFFSIYQGYGGAEEHEGEYANIVAQFADDIAHGRSPKIYDDGTQSRNFTHVDDVVRGLELAAECKLTRVYNLGTGELRLQHGGGAIERGARSRRGAGVRGESDSGVGVRARYDGGCLEDGTGDGLGARNIVQGGH